MLNMNKVLDEAIEKDASDVHLIFGLKPILRVARELQESETADVLSEDELYEAYDYFVRGNIDKDEIYHETKRLDKPLQAQRMVAGAAGKQSHGVYQRQ